MAKQPEGKWIPIHLFRKKTRVSYQENSESSIKSAIKKYANIANKRIRSLQKVNLLQSSSAYKNIIEPKQFDQMEYITGRGYFKTGTKGRTKEQLLEQLDVLERFIKSKTSTISGTKLINEKRVLASIEAMERRGYQAEADYLRNIYQTQGSKAFGEFFRSEAYTALVDMYGSELANHIYVTLQGNNPDLTRIDEIIIKFIRTNGYTDIQHPTYNSFIHQFDDYAENFRFSTVTEDEGEELANNIR